MNSRHLWSKILVQLVALDLALLQIQRKIKTDTGQSAEAVQLPLLDRQPVAHLDVSKIDPRLLLVRCLVRRTDTQFLLVHRVVLLLMIPLRTKMQRGSSISFQFDFNFMFVDRRA